jgi:pseudouridine synthase
MERIHKILARAGVASRRKAEGMIREGRVRINGEIAVIGQSADPARDEITLDGRPVRIERKVYYAFYKPRGVVTTMGEEHGQETVARLPQIRELKERVFPVGRLDKDAEGLLILTNDGDLANALSHPRHEIRKEYRVSLDRPFRSRHELLKGVEIDRRRVEVSEIRHNAGDVFLSIHEGRKHIVKRLFEELGYRVTALKRTRVGPIRLGRLKPGELRALCREDFDPGGAPLV